MELLQKLRCDQCGERADLDIETTQDAIDAGWQFLRNETGDWEYCSFPCLGEAVRDL